MDTYEFITSRINSLKEKYPSLRSRAADYIFSVLCVKNHFYKDNAQTFDETNIAEVVVDGSRDGGADILLSDPNSESSDLIIGQSKFHKTISYETVLNAMRKMADFYKDMKAGHSERFNSRASARFLRLNSERGDDSKIHFVFYTSAPRKKIDPTDIETKFREQFTALEAIEVSILFGDDIKREIDNAEARRPSIERGNIRIDDKDNYLLYGDDAIIVNVSAASVKELYTLHGTNLLSMNLRYHISGGKIDKEIRETIKNAPDSFWFKNNGITIICDSFEIDGNVVKLTNFSIVNGGQTTYVLSKSPITAANDFWLSCKIIKAAGTTQTEKDAFSLEIAKAANAQKPIKEADLKANAPEQRSFKQAMLSVGVFYQTKRGDEIPKQFTDYPYRHTKLLDAGKLCLAAIFQVPCKSRSKPSSVYQPEYYHPIFNGNQSQVAQICKELLYINHYFNEAFLKKFDDDNKDLPNASVRTSFAHVARTICIAFTALAARYNHGNITDKDVTALTASPNSDEVYDKLRDLGDMKTLLPLKLYTDTYDAVLSNLFTAIIEEGITIYTLKAEADKSLTAANFLKRDENYYGILQRRWSTLRAAIRKIFSVT